MKLIGLMPARNEDWVLGLTARAALLWCDELVVLDHQSTDDTAKIMLELAHEYGERFHFAVRGDALWNDMDVRQQLLVNGRSYGGTHFAIIDADEILSGNLLPVLREYVSQLPRHTIFQPPWVCLRDSIDKRMTSGVWAKQYISCVFADEPWCHWKPQANGYDQHHRAPMGRAEIPFRPLCHAHGGLMHLQFVNMARLRAKQAWYQLMERKRFGHIFTVAQIRERFALTVREAESAQLSDVPPSWWEPYRAKGWLKYLHPERDPWQLAEYRRLLAENPGIENGLDDFGIRRMIQP